MSHLPPRLRVVFGGPLGQPARFAAMAVVLLGLVSPMGCGSGETVTEPAPVAPRPPAAEEAPAPSPTGNKPGQVKNIKDKMPKY